MDIEQLQDGFGIVSRLRCCPGEGGLPMIEVETKDSSGNILNKAR